MGLDLASLVMGGAGIVSGIMESRAKAAQRRKVMKLVQEIMMEQRRNLAEAKNRLQAGRAAYMSNPNRTEMIDAAQERVRKGGPITGQVASTMKSNVADQVGRNSVVGMSQLRERLAKQGLAGSGMALAAEQGAARGRDTAIVRGQSDIDIEAAKTNDAAERQNLDQYHSIINGDLQQQYGFDTDYASLLGSVNYGNSLAAIGGA